MKGYITYYNPVLGTIYLTSLTFVNSFPMNWTYERKDAKLFEEAAFKNIVRTFTALNFVPQT